MSDIIITQPSADDFKKILPILASKAFYGRFHNEYNIKKYFNWIIEKENLHGNKFFDSLTEDEKLELAGSLSIFRELKPFDKCGQSYTSFKNYYTNKLNEFLSGSFYIWVAKKNDKIVGFVKGNYNSVDATDERFDLCKKFSKTELKRNEMQEIGSLYVDPNYKESGLGKKLLHHAMKEIKAKTGCKTFITDCYWRNNSQYFFNKFGAKSVGFCTIPDPYITKENGELVTRTKDICGEVMFWDEEQTKKMTDLTKEELENFREPTLGGIQKYTRRSEQYVEKLFECNKYFEAKELNEAKLEALSDELSTALFGVNANWARYM